MSAVNSSHGVPLRLPTAVAAWWAHPLDTIPSVVFYTYLIVGLAVLAFTALRKPVILTAFYPMRGSTQIFMA